MSNLPTWASVTSSEKWGGGVTLLPAVLEVYKEMLHVKPLQLTGL